MKAPIVYMEKVAGIKRSIRIADSLVRKARGGRRGADIFYKQRLMRPVGTFGISDDAIAAMPKGLNDALGRSSDKLYRRISRYKGGPEEYLIKSRVPSGAIGANVWRDVANAVMNT